MSFYKQFHLDEPWDSEHNKPLIAKLPDVFSPDSPKRAGERGKDDSVTCRDPASR